MLKDRKRKVTSVSLPNAAGTFMAQLSGDWRVVQVHTIPGAVTANSHLFVEVPADGGSTEDVHFRTVELEKDAVYTLSPGHEILGSYETLRRTLLLIGPRQSKRPVEFPPGPWGHRPGLSLSQDSNEFPPGGYHG